MTTLAAQLLFKKSDANRTESVYQIKVMLKTINKDHHVNYLSKKRTQHNTPDPESSLNTHTPTNRHLFVHISSNLNFLFLSQEKSNVQFSITHPHHFTHFVCTCYVRGCILL